MFVARQLRSRGHQQDLEDDLLEESEAGSLSKTAPRIQLLAEEVLRHVFVFPPRAILRCYLDAQGPISCT